MASWIACVSLWIGFVGAFACGVPAHAALRPGDHIGQVKLIKAKPNTLNVVAFCAARFTMGHGSYQPGIYRQTCAVAPSAVLGIGPRWIASANDRYGQQAHNMHWMMYLDGRPVDLGAFGDIVTGGTGSGATQHHVWAVALAKPRGTNTLRTILTLDTELNDGEHRYAAGTYDMTTRFTLVFRCRDPHTTSCWRDW